MRKVRIAVTAPSLPIASQLGEIAVATMSAANKNSRDRARARANPSRIDSPVSGFLTRLICLSNYPFLRDFCATDERANPDNFTATFDALIKAIIERELKLASVGK